MFFGELVVVLINSLALVYTSKVSEYDTKKGAKYIKDEGLMAVSFLMSVNIFLQLMKTSIRRNFVKRTMLSVILLKQIIFLYAMIISGATEVNYELFRVCNIIYQIHKQLFCKVCLKSKDSTKTVISRNNTNAYECLLTYVMFLMSWLYVYSVKWHK